MTCCTYECNQGRDCPVRAESAKASTDAGKTVVWNKTCNLEKDIDPDAPDGTPVGAIEAAAFYVAIVFGSLASFAFVIGLFGYLSVAFAKVIS